MRRAGRLFERILQRDNLRLAYAKAARGKRGSSEAREFSANLDDRLKEMADQLQSGTFPVGRYHQFIVYDPKQRIITAPCFAERVLHHAIMNVCEPVFERWLIDDTYACRVGRGRIAALRRAERFARAYPIFLKLDIRKYFDSVSHAILLARLQRIFKDYALLTLLGRIVRAFRGELGRGLPIGALTSQHFANFYLGWVDRFVKEKLRIRAYVRYMDDMALWADSTASLSDALRQCRGYCSEELGLEIKDPAYINRTAGGMDFLGCRVFPDRITLNRRSRVRFRRKLMDLERRFLVGELEELELQQRGTSLVAFARAGGTASWRFRRAVVQRLPVGGPRPPTA